MTDYGYEELSSAYPPSPVHGCIPLLQPDKQIRVLELDPVQLRDPNQAPALEGRLRVLNLPFDEDYTALSYVWAQKDPGTSERENKLVLHCDDHHHEARIGPNCWSALWHLSKTRGSLRIWVDALCVEQGNDHEKAQQILLMRAVYASAHTTYFWLGEATYGTNRAMEFLTFNGMLYSLRGGSYIHMFEERLQIFMMFTCLSTLGLLQYDVDLQDIFKRPWIERLWTLQECLLSQNGIVIDCSSPFRFPYSLAELGKSFTLDEYGYQPEPLRHGTAAGPGFGNR
ncbi:hypothetical protein Daus18300_008009 [Diaporthe australafricana]|uniref:Heterokaryon incompatibility domain-containing protein n=1 Tax=Diaporthe australafricana TaxID=127596 RepID=A0ABR3WJM4_9PEZI